MKQGPFLRNFTACTWNENGLFCVDVCRGNKKLEKLNTLIEVFDIVFIQEAQCGQFKEDFLKNCISHTHICFWSPHENAASGGVGFIINKRFLSSFTCVLPIEEVVPGRIAASRLKEVVGGWISILCTWNRHCPHRKPLHN